MRLHQYLKCKRSILMFELQLCKFKTLKRTRVLKEKLNLKKQLIIRLCSQILVQSLIINLPLCVEQNS